MHQLLWGPFNSPQNSCRHGSLPPRIDLDTAEPGPRRVDSVQPISDAGDPVGGLVPSLTADSCPSLRERSLPSTNYYGAPLIPHKRVGGPRSDPTADGTVRHAVTSQHVITVARTPTSVNWRAELPYPSWAGLWTRHYALGGCPSEFVRLRRFPVFSFSYSRGHSDYFGPENKNRRFHRGHDRSHGPFLVFLVSSSH